MNNKAFFCMTLFCLLNLAAAQQAGGNIWDMIINDDPMNGIEEPIAFQKAPSYGPPTPIASASNIGVSLGAGGSFAPLSLVKPKVEILKLIESALKFSGEVGSRLNALVVDNWDVIRNLFNTFVNNIGTLQAFTVNGIIILRKILEFAYRLFSNWQITVPNVNLDFSTLLRESFNEI